MVFKKGHKAHNKGDSYVKANYRNKPKKKMMKEPEEESDGYDYNEYGGESHEYLSNIGLNFMKQWSGLD